MTFGAILAYLGIAAFAGTVAGLAFVICVAGFQVLALKWIEERELAERFGDASLQHV
jgi:protein-S-isoprenylcysteine O-methyltransferase Ste14